MQVVKVCWLISLFLSFVGCAYASTRIDSTTILEQAVKYEQLGDELLEHGQHNGAVHAFYQAIDAYKKLERWEDVIYCYEGIQYGFFKLKKDVDTAILILKEALTVVDKQVKDTNLTLSLKGQLLMGLGLMYEQKIDFDKAIFYYKQAIAFLEQKKQLNEGDIENRSVCYNNLGKCLFDVGDLDYALTIYDKVLTIIPLSKKQLRAKVLNSQGAIKNKQERYLESKILYEKSLLEIAGLSQFIEDQIIYTNNLANNYIDQGNCDKALDLLDDVLKLGKAHHLDIDQTYQNMAFAYKGKKEYQKAIAVLLLTLSIQEKEALQFRERGITHRQLGDVYWLQKKIPTAFQQYQKSLSTLTYNFKDTTNIHANPDLTQIRSKIDVLKTLSAKAEALYTYYQTQKEAQYLETAFNTYLLIDQLISKIHQSFRSEGSKLFLSEQNRSIYDHAIQTALTLYHLTQDKTYQHQAFYFAEKSKALVLLDAVKDIAAKAELPDTLAERERQLKLQIFQSEKRIQQLSDKLVEQNNEKDNKFNLQQDLQQFRDSLEKNYPKYYQLKYAPTVPTVQEVQQSLSNQTILLEYFVGDSTIYLFAIDKQTINTYTIDKQQVFPSISTLWQKAWNVSEQNRGRKENMPAAIYAEQAYVLYTKLVEQALPTPNNLTNLIIIPDDSLYCVPFDGLITQKKPDIKYYDLKDMPYLLADYACSYAYSSTLLFKDKGRKQIASKASFLGIAPTFGKLNNTKIPIQEMAYRGCLETPLQPLSSAREEILYIDHILNGEIFVDDKAVKRVFKEQANQYAILHLATHACAYPNNSDYNQIHFADSSLFNQEIYHLRLNQTKLAVLSACQSGSGELKPGEGVMSLARAFLYAGCPSVLTNLWNVPDYATSAIMKKFYDDLKAGQSKSEALRQAKLYYLEEVSTSEGRYPHIWAASMVIGQDDAIFIQPNKGFNWFVVIGGVLILLLLVGRSIRKATHS